MSKDSEQSAISVDRRFPRRHSRRASGIGSVEVIVAFTLLTTVMSVAVPLVVRHGRILKDQRDYRLALDELSNQLEVLTVMPAAEVPEELEHLKVSETTADKLFDAALTGQLESADVGSRLTLSISWGGPQRKAHPVTLVGWILPPPQETGDAEQEGDSQ